MTPSFLLLHVDDPARSAAFWGRLLDRAPVEQSPTFALFAVSDGLRLGLWSRHTVEPAGAGGPGAAEIGIPVGTPDEVDAACRRWETEGTPVLQQPTEMDFGRSCVGADPDGHRIRVFCPGD